MAASWLEKKEDPPGFSIREFEGKGFKVKKYHFDDRDNYDESRDEYDPKKDIQGSSDSEEECLKKSKPKTSKPAKWTKQEKEAI